MQAKSWVLAAALAFASTALADDRPRIYFPRNVKRQFFNSTITRDDAFPPAEQTSTPPTTLQTTDGFSSNTEESEQDTLLTTRSEDSDADVITLTIPTTVVVVPTATPAGEESQSSNGSSGGPPETSAQPTSTPEEELNEEPEETDEESDSGIVIAPTGVVSSKSEDPAEQPTDGPAEEADQGEETTDPSPSVNPDQGNSTETPTEESEVPDETDDETTEEIPASSASPTEGEDPATPTEDATEETSAAPSEGEEEEEEETPAEGEEEEETPAEGEEEEETPAEGEKEEETPTEDTVTEAPSPTESVEGGGPVESIISSIIDVLPPDNTTTPGNETDPAEPTITEDPIPDPTENPAGTGSGGQSQPPTSVPPPDTTTDGPTVTGGPGSTISEDPPVSTPTSSGEEPVDTGISKDPGPTVSGNSTVPDGPSSRPTSNPPAPTPVQPEDTTTFTSVPVKSTVTGTPAWLGTKLAADDETSSVDDELPAPTQTSEALPPGTPKTIDAQDEEVAQPDGTTLIRIVFDRRLHYEFVADNYTAAQQIFTYLPKIISFGEGITEEEIKMMRLAPVDANKNGWFPTGGYLYVPTKIIESLQTDIHLPNSALYHHEYPVAFELASAIDPSFGIFPGTEGESDDDTDPGGAPFTNNDDAPEEQTPQQQGATAGITLGAVSVAVAYGAAMFIVARRYKRKKQAHRRTSSVTNSSDMRYSASGSPHSPAVMGGALISNDMSSYGGVAGGRESHGSGRSGAGNSGRTAYISAPVAAENSLGWN